jgi:hypothetical protein
MGELERERRGNHIIKPIDNVAARFSFGKRFSFQRVKERYLNA